jgi:type IV pilus assembly protein PilV
MKYLSKHRFNQRGVSLIEVLVTALIMGVGLIGMATLQSKSTQFNQGAYLRSQANLLAYDIAERMRTNRSDAISGSASVPANGSVAEVPAVPNAYNTTYTTDENGSSSIAQKDLAEWKDHLGDYLGDLAEGQIDCVTSTKQCTISIRWSEPGQSLVDTDNDTKLNPTNEFVYVTSF